MSAVDASPARRAAPGTRARLVNLLDEDPDLFAEVGAAARDTLARHAVVPAVALPAGVWRRPDALREHAPFGLLVLDGLVARRVVVERRAGVELLAAGDVLRPWVGLGGAALLAPDIGWEAVAPTEVALLDARFATLAARAPEIGAALLDRLLVRTGWLALQLATSQQISVKPRLLAALWAFADRWGRMTRDGVLVPVALTHALLAEVVGARRPSVTNAMGELRREGRVERVSGGWRLHGESPSELLNA